MVAKVLVAALVLGASWAAPAGAATIRWDIALDDPDFEQALNGSFRFDTVTQAFSDASLLFSYAGFDTIFDVLDPARSAPGALVLFKAGTDLLGSLGGAEYLLVGSAGGTWGDLDSTLDVANIFVCFDATCEETDGVEQLFTLLGKATPTIIGDEPSPIPLPASGLLLAAAVGGLALRRSSEGTRGAGGRDPA